MTEHDKKYDLLLQRVATNLKTIRVSRGLTQEEMTDFGFNYRHYQRLESGQHSITLHTLYRLAVALKVEITDFFA